MEIRIESVQKIEDKIKAVVAVFDSEEKLYSRHYTVRTKSELDKELANLEYWLSQRDVEIAQIITGKWTKPKHEVIHTKQTPEQIKAQAIDQAQYDVDEALERARKDKEVIELAKTDTHLADKLQALWDLKQRKKIG